MTEIYMKDIANINIETKRLKLRNLQFYDISSDYIDWLNDPDVNKYLCCANSVQTKESCLEYVRSYEGKNDKALIGVFFKDNGLHIGNLTLSEIDWHNKIGFIGICIGRKEYARRQLAKEALTAMIKYGFSLLELHCFRAGINVTNEVSINLFPRCGFKIAETLKKSDFINGEFQDGYVVSICETDVIN
jgi:RimJ/RimL family protein N-acetyltransferase